MISQSGSALNLTDQGYFVAGLDRRGTAARRWSGKQSRRAEDDRRRHRSLLCEDAEIRLAGALRRASLFSHTVSLGLDQLQMASQFGAVLVDLVARLATFEGCQRGVCKVSPG